MNKFVDHNTKYIPRFIEQKINERYLLQKENSMSVQVNQM
jgi:hypothetical protein